jgi:hypothetical protein
LEAQLRQKALELLLQRVGRNTPACDVVGTINPHGAGKLPLVSSSFALCHELLLDLSHSKLLESLRIHGLLCHLLTERHDIQGRALRRRSREDNSLFPVPMLRKTCNYQTESSKASGFTNRNSMTRSQTTATKFQRFGCSCFF